MFRKSFVEFFISLSALLSKNCSLFFKNILQRESLTLIWFISLKDQGLKWFHFVGKIVKHVLRRQYDTRIIETTITGLVLHPSLAKCNLLLNAFAHPYKLSFYYAAIFLKTSFSLWIYYSRWLSWLISIVWASSSCERQERRKQFKMKLYVSSGIQTSNPPHWKLTRRLRLLGYPTKILKYVYLCLLRSLHMNRSNIRVTKHVSIWLWFDLFVRISEYRYTYWCIDYIHRHNKRIRFCLTVGEKGRALTLPYDKSPYTHRKL